MKIVQVTPRYAPNTGGVETHVQEVSERLVERGHDVLVVTADDGDDVPTREVRNGVRIRRHRGFAPGGAVHATPGIAATIRRADADVVHAHNYHSLPLFFAALGVTDERFVVTPHYHGASASDVRDRLLSLYRPFGRWALGRADAVVAVSEWERDLLQDDFGVKATVVPNGIDIERFTDAEPVERERPYLLCVGRLVEYKGVQYAIRALPRLPEYDFVVAGAGPFEAELHRLAAERGVDDRVEFLGYVDDEALPGWYTGAAAFVTLSSFEAYGLTVGEAMAAGTPCVVREAGALSSWTTHDYCVGVSSTAPDDVARAVRNCVERTARDSGLPTWGDVVDELESIYDGLAVRLQ